MRKLNTAPIGYKFTGKSHSFGLMAASFFFRTRIEPVRKVIVGRTEAPLRQAVTDFGREEYSTDRRATIECPDIDVVSIVTPPGTHAEIAIAAAKAGIPGPHEIASAICRRHERRPTDVSVVSRIFMRKGYKHIFCEKPFTVTAEETLRVIDAVNEAAQSTRMEPMDVDDAAVFLAKFHCGTLGTFESTRFAAGHRNHERIEINGSKGSRWFDLENMNHLHCHSTEDDSDVRGFRTIQANKSVHPYTENYWPAGLGVGYENRFISESADFFRAIAEDEKSSPGFEIGPGNRKVLDAVSRSIAENRRVEISRQKREIVVDRSSRQIFRDSGWTGRVGTVDRSVKWVIKGVS
ncbi:MAG: Gfo/Idh/MocA family oxidoreductase [Planctomycetia bacterium]|nr:Gfo/Idh/MocA family oxidoreductase [Planctomycetia bacterium]